MWEENGMGMELVNRLIHSMPSRLEGYDGLGWYTKFWFIHLIISLKLYRMHSIGYLSIRIGLNTYK